MIVVARDEADETNMLERDASKFEVIVAQMNLCVWEGSKERKDERLVIDSLAKAQIKKKKKM